MHIGIVGPIHIPSLKKHIKADVSNWINGMGGTPVNHQINALLEKGKKVSVFSLSPEIEPGDSLEWHQDNLSIFVGPFRKKARHRCLDLFYQERKFLKKAMLSVKPDIIHAHWQYEWAWAALDSGIPTLVTCHDAPIRILQVQKDLYRFIRLIMAKIVLIKAKHLTAVSPYTATGLRHLTKKKITIIPNFEPDAVFQLYKGKKKIGTAPKIAMVNNGFYGLKNVSTGIEAFVAYQKLFPEAELHLYGHGHGLGQEAEKWCSEKGYKKGIYFKGEMNFDDLIIDFSRADILLHTSFEESCPMVVIEAFAMGMPVIGGIKSGGMPWMIEDGCGCLVDVTDMNEVLQSLIELSKPCEYSLNSLNARKLAIQRFSSKSVLKQYTDLYSYLLQSETKLSQNVSKPLSFIR